MTLLWAAAVFCAHAALPLTSVAYTVDVDGPLAELTIDQTFINDGPDTIEAVYVFPLHEEAAVDRMHMVVGERFIEGQILELGEAEEAYEEALEEGHTAAITTQQRPNLFTQRVGNLPPGEQVTVRLRIVQPVPHVDGAYELVIPLVAAPRFVPAEAWDAQTMPAHDTFETGPPIAGGGTPLRASLDVMIDSGLPFTSFGSPSHPLDLVHDEDLALALVDDVPLDRDVVLRWAVAQDRPIAAMHTMDDHAVLTLEPPQAPPREQVVPRELVWVIDQSCSMSGQPIELVRAAMLEALQHTDARDSLRILQFSNEVTGDAAARPITPDVLRDAKARIHALNTGGGTYLLDGVLAALQVPPDPERERMVMFLTDGQIGYENEVLAAIADEVGDGRLFTLGVGSAPNRWLLDEMARFGGGKATWLRDGEAPDATVRRFVDTIDRPVLTDIVIDWGDWEVADTWPTRLPALYAGQPLLVTTRILRRGTTPVVVRGRLGDGPFETVITPVEAEAGRAIPSTWARQAIGHLERDQVWGEDAELADRILQTSLDYQVLSQYTAFYAVDRDRTVEPGERTEEQPAALPYGQQLVQSGTPVRGTFSMDFANRVPAGRSYQNAVQFAPGAVSATQTSGTTISTSSFSCIVIAHTLEPLPALDLGDVPGTLVGPPNALPNGTNNLEADVGGALLTGPDALRYGTAHAEASGPIVRDHVWLNTRYRFDQAELGPRSHQRHSADTTLTVQPNAHHHTTAFGSGRLEQLSEAPPRALTQDVVMGGVGHRWHLDPYATATAEAVLTRRASLGDRRTQRQADVAFGWTGDSSWGDHDAVIGADLDDTTWTAEGTGLATWLGVPVAPTGSVTRIGLHAQESWRAVQAVELSAGLRSDLTLGRGHLAPSAFVAWHPGGSDRTTLRAGGARRFGHTGIATAVLAPDVGLSRHDELIAELAHELIDDLTFTAIGARQLHRDVPQLGGGRADLGAWTSGVVLRKWYSRRWNMHVAWSHAVRTDTLALVDDGSLPGFADVLDGALSWSLPTNPYTHTLSATGALHATPLGTLVPDLTSQSLPNAPHWTVGVRLSQEVPLRTGSLHFDLDGEHVQLLDDARDLSRFVLAQQLLPRQVGWGGLRVRGGVRYVL